MKFAKELEENAVAEWRSQYLDYKGAKKGLKAMARAMRNADRPDDREKQGRKSPFASLRDAPVYSMLQRERGGNWEQSQPDGCGSGTPLVRASSRSEGGEGLGRNTADGGDTPKARLVDEHSPLQSRGKEAPRLARYGSIIGTPPDECPPDMAALRLAPSLELPDPAIPNARNSASLHETDFDYDRSVSESSPVQSRRETLPHPPPTQLAHTGNAHKIGKPTDNVPRAASSSHFDFLRQQKRLQSTNEDGPDRPFVRRMFSIAPSPRNPDIALEAYREVDFRRTEFFIFLDKELLKIERFYKQKEDEAVERMNVLREQLHIMRDRRLDEIIAARQRKHKSGAREDAITAERGAAQNGGSVPSDDDGRNSPDIQSSRPASRNENAKGDRVHPLRASVAATREVLEKVRTGHVGKTSKAMGELGTPDRALGVGPGAVHNPAQDYTRKPQHGVPYRTAKRKLKIALAEFYRGLELLKSYALLNRTAFRKINKKFDKTVNAHPALRYMSEKVNVSHFVQSSTPDDLITQAEDLYARYFERGNHKVAVSKLRAKVAKAGDYTGPIFRTGFFLAAGLVLGIQGVVWGSQRLRDTTLSPVMRTNTAYLLQIYAGYFLMLLLVSIFVVDAAIFSKFHVNYQFIFEFDTRHMLDWKQLSEMPACFCFLLGLTMCLNFSKLGAPGMGPYGLYIFWPVILIGVSAILLLFPPPFFYPLSRRWLLNSNARLLVAGLFPVEFRDFFLGDMFCSLTYAVGNIELFFCLYAQHWSNPPQCNSSHSMFFGFLTTTPGLVRLFQCGRRYYDSGLWTHIANGVKYSLTVLQYVSLSTWRINKAGGNPGWLAFLLVSASLNSLYCAFWDLNYDWSMPLKPNSRPYPLLRPMLAFQKRIWWYYIAIFLDPILRFNWIFYVIYKDDAQHSSLVSFLIALSEVIRRGAWVIFRVENEHCANVGRSRAMRDPELPYEIRSAAPASEDAAADGETLARLRSAASQGLDGAQAPPSTVASGRDVEAGLAERTTTSISLRQRRQGVARAGQEGGDTESPVYTALQRVGSTFMAAHSQDYERKRKPWSGLRDEAGSGAGVAAVDEEDEDGDSESDGYDGRGRGN